MRIRENQWDQLGRAIDDLVMNREYPLDVTEFLKWLQASLTKRQGIIDEFSQEHQNIQQDVNILDALLLWMDCNYESDGYQTRVERVAKLKAAFEKLEVVP
ncbi:MAG: hypothetical protein LV471_09095 [Nitrosomonas sp.]|nr:hypothetical protein [Nitrosomonas sp.]